MSTAALKPTLWRVDFAYWHEFGLALLLLAVMVVAGLLEPRFVQPAQQVSLAGDVWPMAMVALPMALIVITGGIDLSVGGMTALCAVAFATFLEAGGSPALGILLTLFLGGLCGLINALLIARLALHPLIVTLATMACFRGIALAVTKGRTIQSVPEHLSDQVQGSYIGLPLPMIVCLAAFAIVAMLLTRSPYGRFLYAIGHNEVAARYSGIPTAKIKLALYTASGLAAGGAAILMATRYGQAKADFANGLELEVITAVVLGGISIFGGRGNLVGLAIGLILLHQCRKFVPWHWHVSELSALVTGILLIGSVLLNTFLNHRRSR
jgi:rhamnose transport system permease protein